MLFPTDDIRNEKLSDILFDKMQVSVTVLRLDTIHPVVSGNKLFKLHYFLENAIKGSYEDIVTFGGAWSNHLVATAFAGKQMELNTIGIVRGEQPKKLSTTLSNCLQYGMQLHFIPRELYDQKDEHGFINSLNKDCQHKLVIPEGGYHPAGANGAALIMQFVPNDATHICTAAGTATTLAGLLMGAKKEQQIIGIPVLKGMMDLPERIAYLTNNKFDKNQLAIMPDYHFGGYAKKTPALIDFMNEFYKKHAIPTDFVYTAKMMYGVFDLIDKGYFKKGSNIICIHTGGLQGNLSLPPGTLAFN
ncbi:MAG: pyridoxal-phosphate dependent enzyme [Ferruginibacter sp.]